MTTKICTSCLDNLDLEKFGTYVCRRQTKNGIKYSVYYNSRCKDCASTISNNWYYDNIDKVKEDQKDYYLKTKDVSLDSTTVEEYNTKYLLENKTRICNTCMIEKNIDDFERGFNKGKVYHRKKCKECDKPRQDKI